MLPTFHNQSPHKSGFSLIEAAIVLGVIGLVIGGLWVAAASVMEKNRVNDTARGILYTAQMLNQNFTLANGNALASGTGITTYAIKAQLVPPNWIVGSTLKDAWGGTISVNVPNNFVTSPRLDIGFSGLPADRCKALSMEVSKFFKADAGNNQSVSALKGIYLGTEARFAPLPATVDLINSFCTSTQSMIFVVNIDRG